MVSCKFLAQTDRFMFLDLNVLSRAAGFYLVFATYLSNGPLTLYLQSQFRSVNGFLQISCTDRFMFLDLNVLSRAAGFYLVLSENVFLFFSQSRESH